MQHPATHCHTLLRTATHCHTVPHTETYCTTHWHKPQHSAIHCYTLQPIQNAATQQNTSQHVATHRNTLQYTATHWNCNTMRLTSTDRKSSSTCVSHHNTSQHTSTYCNTWQHTVTATQSNTLQLTCTCLPTRIASVIAPVSKQFEKSWQCFVVCCIMRQCTSIYVHYNTLHHYATLCSILQNATVHSKFVMCLLACKN